MELLALLAEDPPSAAIFLDIDGVLAPIVSRPEDAGVADDVRDELRRLAGRYALVACVTGRPPGDARAIVGVRELTYVGNHGLDLDPDAERWAERLQDFLSTVTWPRIEDKRVAVSLHFRGMPDEERARDELDAIADRARQAGFVTRYGRKVLELLPPVEANKGTAVRRLLQERELDRALYAGDDTTDLDAFAALDGLALAVRVGVASEEGPRELRDRADVVLGSQAEVVGLLRQL